MTTKEILNQYRFKIKKAEEAKDEFDKFMTRATKVTATLSEATSRSNVPSDKVGDNAVIIADLKNEWEKRWLDAERERLTTVDMINKISEPYRTILMERYVHQKNFEEISVQLKYSYAWTTHLHGEALQEFEKCFKNVTENVQQNLKHNK